MSAWRRQALYAFAARADGDFAGAAAHANNSGRLAWRAGVGAEACPLGDAWLAGLWLRGWREAEDEARSLARHRPPRPGTTFAARAAAAMERDDG